MSPWTPTVLQWTTRLTPAVAAASMTVRTAAAFTARYSLIAKTGLTIDGGDVVDDLDAACGLLERGSVAQIAGDGFDAGFGERGSGRPHQRLHRVAARGQGPRQVTAGEAGGAGD